MSLRWRGCLLEIVETVLLTVVIFFVVHQFVAEPREISQASMEHTLEPHQFVLVDKLSPVFSDYKRGDVIIFNPPPGFQENGDVPFIKRVIGVANDLVEIHDDSVWINGVKLIEPYVYDGQSTAPTTGQSSWRIGPGQLFVMGDHRQESQDSRAFGPIEKSTVIGRAWLRYWPLSTLGWVGSASYPGVPNASPLPSGQPAILPSPSGL
jgi:signal peptidase I